MTRRLIPAAALLAVAVSAAVPAIAEAGFSKPVTVGKGASTVGLGTNDRGDRVVAFATKDGLRIGFSPHGQTRFGHAHLVSDTQSDYLHDIDVQVAPDGTALITWIDETEEAWEQIDIRDEEVACCDRARAVIARPGKPLGEPVTVTPGQVYAAPSKGAIRTRKRFAVAAATYTYTGHVPAGPNTGEYTGKSDFAIYARFSRSNGTWGPVTKLDRGHQSQLVGLSASLASTYLTYSRPVDYSGARVLVQQAADRRGRVGPQIDTVGRLDGGIFTTGFGADARGGVIYAWRTRGSYYSDTDNPLHVVTAAPGHAPVDYSFVESQSAQDATATAVASNGRAAGAAVHEGELLVAGRRPGGRFGPLDPRVRVPRGSSLFDLTLAVNASGGWGAAVADTDGIYAVVSRGARARSRRYPVGYVRYSRSRIPTAIDGHGTTSVAWVDYKSYEHIDESVVHVVRAR